MGLKKPGAPKPREAKEGGTVVNVYTNGGAASPGEAESKASDSTIKVIVTTVVSVVLAVVSGSASHWFGIAAPSQGTDGSTSARQIPPTTASGLPAVGSGASAAATTTSKPAATTPIAIDRNVLTEPECANITGTGDEPLDRTFQLIVVSAGVNYFFPVTANAAAHTWIAENVQLGAGPEDTGNTFKVEITLFDDAAEKWLQSQDLRNGTSDLPPGVSVVDSLKVTRESDTRSSC